MKFVSQIPDTYAQCDLHLSYKGLTTSHLFPLVNISRFTSNKKATHPQTGYPANRGYLQFHGAHDSLGYFASLSEGTDVRNSRRPATCQGTPHLPLPPTTSPCMAAIIFPVIQPTSGYHLAFLSSMRGCHPPFLRAKTHSLAPLHNPSYIMGCSLTSPPLMDKAGSPSSDDSSNDSSDEAATQVPPPPRPHAPASNQHVQVIILAPLGATVALTSIHSSFGTYSSTSPDSSPGLWH